MFPNSFIYRYVLFLSIKTHFKSTCILITFRSFRLLLPCWCYFLAISFSRFWGSAWNWKLAPCLTLGIFLQNKVLFLQWYLLLFTCPTWQLMSMADTSSISLFLPRTIYISEGLCFWRIDRCKNKYRDQFNCDLVPSTNVIGNEITFSCDGIQKIMQFELKF